MLTWSVVTFTHLYVYTQANIPCRLIFFGYRLGMISYVTWWWKEYLTLTSHECCWKTATLTERFKYFSVLKILILVEHRPTFSSVYTVTNVLPPNKTQIIFTICLNFYFTNDVYFINRKDMDFHLMHNKHRRM